MKPVRVLEIVYNQVLHTDNKVLAGAFAAQKLPFFEYFAIF